MEDRNATSHIYNEKLADEIADRIKHQYIQVIEKMVESIRACIESE